MIKILAWSFLALVTGYLVGLFGGMALVNRVSSNRHDKAVEAAMTGAFVIGPACAVVAVLATLGYFLVLAKR